MEEKASEKSIFEKVSGLGQLSIYSSLTGSLEENGEGVGSRVGKKTQKFHQNSPNSESKNKSCCG